LRADWDEQHRILTEDLKNWRQEFSQRQALSDEQKRVFSLDVAKGMLPACEVVAPETAALGGHHGGSFQSDSEPTIGALAGSPTSRAPLPENAPFRTVIEGSYVVEKEAPRTDFSAHRAPFKPDSLRSPVQPIGRRHSSESLPVEVALADRASSPDGVPSVSSVSGNIAQGLSVVEPTASGTALSLGDSKTRKLTGRRKQADDDRMGAFVTDRLVLREQARRLWLRMLWGFAATISLLALATLVYLVLTHSG
jgi:hypothetical protein